MAGAISILPERHAAVMAAGWSAFNERRLDDFIELFTDDAVLRSALVAGLEGGVLRGHDGVRAFWVELDRAFEGLRGEPQQAIAIGDHTASVVDFEGTSRESGVPVTMRLYQVSSLRGNAVADLYSTADPAEAFREFARRLEGAPRSGER